MTGMWLSDEELAEGAAGQEAAWSVRGSTHNSTTCGTPGRVNEPGAPDPPSEGISERRLVSIMLPRPNVFAQPPRQANI